MVNSLLIIKTLTVKLNGGNQPVALAQSTSARPLQQSVSLF